jgi:transketolase
VLPADVEARVAVEQAAALGWDRYAGRLGAKVVMHTFGASAPLADLKKKFGFTLEHVYEAARQQIARVQAKRGSA